jgi:hypothetical protein
LPSAWHTASNADECSDYDDVEHCRLFLARASAHLGSSRERIWYEVTVRPATKAKSAVRPGRLFINVSMADIW